MKRALLFFVLTYCISNLVSSQGNAEVPILNSENLLYLVQVQVGNQELTLQIDTGSSVLWVAGKTSANSQFSTLFSGCSNLNDCTNLELPYNVEYGNGQLEGTIYKGPVSIGGLNLTNFEFVVASSVPTMPLSFYQYAQGVLGLAGNMSSNFELPMFIQQLEAQNQIETASFGLLLGQSESGVTPNATGTFYIGGFGDAEGNSNLHLSPAMYTYQNAWTSTVVSFAFGQLYFPQLYMQVVIDSGASFGGLPAKIFDALVYELNQEGGKCNALNGDYIFCSQINSSASVVFGFPGGNVAIPLASLFLNDENGDFLLGLSRNDPQGNPLDYFWLGDYFLNNVISVFDTENYELGFVGLTIPNPPTPNNPFNPNNSSNSQSSLAEILAIGALAWALILTIILCRICIQRNKEVLQHEESFIKIGHDTL